MVWVKVGYISGLAIMFLLSWISPLTVDYNATNVYSCVTGNLTTYSPTDSYVSLPLTVNLVGTSGQCGNIAYGLFNMVQWNSSYNGYPYDTLYVNLKVNNATVTNDVGLIRMGIATAYLKNGVTYYLEYDFWDSANTINQMNGTWVWYQPNGNPPTVETKVAQLNAGGSAQYFSLPIQSYFNKVYNISGANLDAVYLVVEKTNPASTFNFSVTMSYLGLK